MTSKKNNHLTLVEIRKKMLQHYANKYGGTGERKLLISAHLDNHGTIGSFFFSLDGSPPKGYAIYIPGHSMINFYDPRGKRYNYFENIRILELTEKDGFTPRKDFKPIEINTD